MRPLASSTLRDPTDARRRLVELDEDGAPGQPVTLRGFNLSGAAKNIGLPFDPRPDADLVARAQHFLPRLADDGFDLLRIPVVWEFLQPQPDADLDPAIAAAIRALVAYARDLGFRVLIDIHQDVLGSFFRDPDRPTYHGDGLPAWLIERAYGPGPGEAMPLEWRDTPPIPVVHVWGLNYIYNGAMQRAMRGLGRPGVCAAFEQFARRLAALLNGLDNVVTYEVLNEPDSGSFPEDVHRALASAVRAGLGEVVREGSTPTWSVMPAGDWLDGPSHIVVPRIDDDPVSIAGRTALPAQGTLASFLGDAAWLVTPHFYDPRAEPIPLLWPEPERYESVARAAEALFAAWDVVPIVGEYGCASEREERDDCHAAFIDAFERRGWSWCLWNLNPDAGPDDDDAWCGERFSVAQRSGASAEVTLSPAYYALLRPFPRRHGGPLLDVAWDGSRFTARIGAAFRPGWRTEIYVPASLGEFEVTGGAEVRGRVVVVDTDAGEREVSITFARG